MTPDMKNVDVGSDVGKTIQLSVVDRSYEDRVLLADQTHTTNHKTHRVNG